MATIPIQDIDLALVETRRAIEQLGLCGIMLRSASPDPKLPFNHPHFDPLWALCQDLDIPVALHPATHVDFPNAVRLFDLINREANVSVNNRGTDQLRGGGAISHAVGAPVDAIVCLSRFIMGGVCERFPRLRLLHPRVGRWLAARDPAHDGRRDPTPVPKSASGCRISRVSTSNGSAGSASVPDDPTLVPTVQLLGDDRVLWATDFPHLDGIYPGAVDTLTTTTQSLPAESRARIAGANAIAAYGLH